MNSRDPSSRRARVQELQSASQRAERRRSLVILGGFGVVTAVVIGLVAFAIVDMQREQSAVQSAAQGEIDGVQDFEDLSRNHVTEPVDYPQTPSVGGDHASVWTNCGAYSEPVDPMQSTHSLEHGAVWIGYDPQLAEDQVEALTAVAAGNDYVLVSPVEGLPAPVTASAWGHQLQLESADDERLETFVVKYAQSEEAPEPGAPCSGGVGAL